MPNSLSQTIAVLKVVVPLALWLLFWLLAVDWRKLWPVLRIGGWLPPVLLIVVSAYVWARIVSEPCTCLPFVTIPNFWWQLGEISGLAVIALFCGWLQSHMGWAPVTVAIDPPASDDHGHATHH